MSGLSYGSVCSGIEAASTAWHTLGWQPVFFSEIEPFPCSVLAHHWPAVPNLGDLTQHETWTHEPIDLLVGGTPCQAFSVAGLREGLADPRGNLTLTFLALVKRTRPRWVVWENVPGVLSDATNAFGHFLSGLAELGYGWAYRVLDAQYFGVAQRRRRVFVVACAGADWRRAAAVLFEPDCLRGNPPPSRQAGQRPAGTFKACASSGGWSNSADHAAAGYMIPVADVICMAHGQGGAEIGMNRGPTLTCNHEAPIVTHSLRGEGFDASEDGTGRGTPLGPVAIDTTQITSAANRSNPKQGDPCHPLAAAAHPPAVCFEPGSIARHAGPRGCQEVASTLRKEMGDNQPAVLLPNMRVRRLTPRECERLQGFPDDHTLVPHRGKPAADGPRYKAIGNSMAVPVMAWIGQRIHQLESALPYFPISDLRSSISDSSPIPTPSP